MPFRVSSDMLLRPPLFQHYYPNYNTRSYKRDEKHNMAIPEAIFEARQLPFHHRSVPANQPRNFHATVLRRWRDVQEDYEAVIAKATGRAHR